MYLDCEEYTIAPPMGTIKFLSVLEIMISNFPNLFARLIELIIFEHYNPYALFNKWYRSYFLQISLIFSMLSGTRGAKQLPVEIIHKIFSMPIYFIFSSISEILLWISSPRLLIYQKF